jgi:hypothetical protein
MAGSRTVILIRIYLTLVSVSLLLVAIHVYRHFPALFVPGNPTIQSVRVQPYEQAAVRAGGPVINWGGQRR